MIELVASEVEHIDTFIEMEQESDTEHFIIPYTRSQHLAQMRQTHTLYLSIFCEGRLSGFFILVKALTGDVEFRRVVIAKKHRGIGQQAIKEMALYCKVHLGAKRIWLDVFATNSRGIHVYRKLGYHQFGVSQHRGKQLILMEKHI
ncbi:MULTISPECIES: GNAT family N-acetyltransferase [Pseudoalteromonas]|uniref:GNAT family N-acetyltransferase n=1 Tax=Pseudoalteromonas obscura TaxID=3048491 RepID=A0ABT7EF65_9GAMM|nr:MULTISPECIES: GNAT family N-acetyltransferase [Pseudoalteromonas]MBQ4835844.1 GNAT family N-acetyltransferase [Pseudoalteromonas luteoviolacea]MDK2593911.1 GNAT family N-acetyltransferase [Pseudoalteromonas sp. P94(2023)]